MNMMKKNGGFTLVELIVVIAILAILAGVAVPAYSGYIKKANDAAVVTELSAVLTAAQAKAAEGNTTVASIDVAAAGTVSVGVTKADGTAGTAITDLSPYYTVSSSFAGNCAKSATYAAGAEWAPSTGWVAGS